VVRAVIGRPTLAAVLFALVLVVGAGVAPRVGRGFLPSMDEGAFVLDYFLPAGTSLASTQDFARKIEQELKATPEVLDFTRRTGAELGPAAATQVNVGDVMVRLRDRRSRTSEDIIADLRARLERDLPEVRIEFVQVLQDVLNDLAGSPRPIEVKFFGPDYAKLHEVADAVAERIQPVAGLVDVYNGHERDAPDLRFAMRRDEIARLGSSPNDVSEQLDASLHGQVVGSIRRYDRLVGVRVRFPNPVRFDPAHVLDMPYLAHDRPTTFRAVTSAEFTTSPSLLMHEALQPMVAVTGDHEHRDLGSVADEVEAVVRKMQMPPGYRYLLGGQIESQRATLRQLAVVGGAAVLLVLTVLASQFRRLRLAALVLASVPVAIVGALVGLYATGIPLNASSLMGCVLLVGLVVKNGVLLLEEAEKRFDAGASPADAVAQASDRRLRPVVMTTLATLAGLFPLALGIGSGAELQKPLAVAVIAGLLTATAATLGLLPPFAAVALRKRATVAT